MTVFSCCFCGSTNLKLKYENIYHRHKSDYGPFFFYKCLNCSSLLTRPLPSKESLKSLYSSYDDGISDIKRIAREHQSITSWYMQCIRNIKKYSYKQLNENFSWIDIGAGAGELAQLMVKEYPNSIGYAMDYHNKPAQIKDINQIKWLRTDLNENFSKGSLGLFDLIYSISVIEHVLDPYEFIQETVKLIKPGGILYLVGPNYKSMASIIMRQNWPYFTPGIHINIPTIPGMIMMLKRILKSTGEGDKNFKIFSKCIQINYPIRYILRFINLNYIANLTPKNLYFPFPTGALEAGFLKN